MHQLDHRTPGQQVHPNIPFDNQFHVYLSGNKVIKAFTANNFIFYNKSVNLFILQNDKSADIAKKIKITWRIQKKRQNGQEITLSAVDNHPQLCPICAALQMVLQA